MKPREREVARALGSMLGCATWILILVAIGWLVVKLLDEIGKLR